MTIKGDDSEGISKKALDWLTGVSAIATILTTIFGLFGDNKKAQLWAFAAAIILAIISSSIYFYQRRRAAKLKIAESLEPLSATAALRGLLPFEEGDDLPGRGRDVQDIYTLVSSSTFRFGVLWGESGCGKTSLLRAGLVPKLRNENYLSLYIPRPTQNPQEAIALVLAKESGRSTLKNDKDLKSQLKAAALKRKKVVILFDQFEEFFLTNRTLTSRASFIKWLASIVNDEKLPIVFLIGIRGDFFDQLQSFAPQIPEPTSTRSTYQLQNFDTEQAKQIFNAAAKADGIPFEPELIQAVIRELETEEFIRPAELQVVGTRLKRKNITRLNQYEVLGGSRGILSSYINEEIKQSANEQAARLILRLMCADAAETKSPTDLDIDDILRGVSGSGEISQLQNNVRQDEIQKIIDQFVAARVLIHTDEAKYNLAHDYLAPYVRTATEGVETNTERANRMLKRYVAEYKEDRRTRIPFGHIRLIQRYASAEAKSGEKSRELIKKSQQKVYVMAGGILAIPMIMFIALYGFLANSYYFSIENSFVVLRTGQPQLQFFPGFDEVVIQTDFKERDLDVQFREEIIRGEVTGFWSESEDGYQEWGEQLIKRLSPLSQTSARRWLSRPESLIETMINAPEGDVRSNETAALLSLAKVRPEAFTADMLTTLFEFAIDERAAPDLRSDAMSVLAALALGKPELLTPEMFQNLFDYYMLIIEENSQYDSGYEVARAAAEAFGQLAQARPELVTPEIFQKLFASLSLTSANYSYYDVDQAIANVFVQIAQTRPEWLTSELFQGLFASHQITNDLDPSFEVPASRLLTQLAQVRPERLTSEIFHNLFDFQVYIAITEYDYDVARAATEDFGRLAQARPELITSRMLQSLIDFHTDPETFRYAYAATNETPSLSYTLGLLAQARPELVTSKMLQDLIDSLKNPASQPSTAPYAVGELAQVRPELVTSEMFQSLLDVIASPETASNASSSDVYALGQPAAAAYTLGQLAQARPDLVTPQMFPPLIDFLTHSEDFGDGPNSHFFVGNAFSQLAQVGPEFVTSQMFQNAFDILNTSPIDLDVTHNMRYYSITHALGQTAQAKPELITSRMLQNLVNSLSDPAAANYEYDVSFFAADTLSQLAQARPELVTSEMFLPLVDGLSTAQYDIDREFLTAYTLGQLAQARPELVTSEMLRRMISIFNDLVPSYDEYTSSTYDLSYAIYRYRIRSYSPTESQTVETLRNVIKDMEDRQAYRTVPIHTSYAIGQLAQAKPDLVTSEMVEVLSKILIDPYLDVSTRCSVEDTFGYLAQAAPERITSEMFQTLMDSLHNQLLNADQDVYAFVTSCSALPSLTRLSRIESQTVVSRIIPGLMTALKSDTDSITRKTVTYALFEIALGNEEYENIIRKQLQDLQTATQPHWRMAASQALEMIAIGDWANVARSNPDQIDDIKAKLNYEYLPGSENFNFFSDTHIQFAAQTVLKELEIIQSESK